MSHASFPRFALLVVLLVLPASALSQVHYHEGGRPWNQRAEKGPDAEVPGWYYNLGVTGLRAELVAAQPKALLIRHVFKDTPAYGRVKVGDYIVGAGGKPFEEEHKNGYGMDKFGADGPIVEFARALEQCMGSGKKRGVLRLWVIRAGKRVKVDLPVGATYGRFSSTFPASCKKSDRILTELLAYLAEHQNGEGSWGSPPHDTFAPLALLASGEKKYLPLVEKCARFHARTTSAKDDSWLINWRYMAAAIVLSEYYLATKAEWVPKELREIYEFLLSSQYTDLSQVDEKTKKDRPEDLPKTPLHAHGGWGHNPGFEGYGPIAMLTGQGALAFALMERCGVEIDRKRHDFAYEFLHRGAGANGYVWYGDQKGGGPNDWADMGRTGAAGLAYLLSPYSDAKYLKRAKKHVDVIGEHPESFPDTHGSPVMGMGYAAAAASFDPKAFRRLMDSNRWWFVMAQCCDGSFYYQPNRDNAGYGDDSRISASAVTAFILSLPKKSLAISGRRDE